MGFSSPKDHAHRGWSTHGSELEIERCCTINIYIFLEFFQRLVYIIEVGSGRGSFPRCRHSYPVLPGFVPASFHPTVLFQLPRFLKYNMAL